MPSPPDSGNKDTLPLDLLKATADLADDDFDFELENTSGPATAGSDVKHAAGAEEIREPAHNTKSAYAGKAPDLPPGLVSAVSHKTPEKKTHHLLHKPQAAAGSVPPGLLQSVGKKTGMLGNLSEKWIYVLVACFIGVCTAGYYMVYPLVSMPSYGVARTAAVPRPEARGGDAVPSAVTARDEPTEDTPENRSSAPVEAPAAHIDGMAATVAQEPAAAVDQVASGSPREESDPAARASKPEAPAAESSQNGTGAAVYERPVDYYLYSGYAQEQSGQPGQALALYKKASALRPADHKLLNKIGALLISLGQHAEARPYLEKALSVKQDYGAALINLGIVAARSGQSADAERYVSQALTLDSTSRDALAAMMLLCKMQGDFSRAGRYQAQLRALGSPAEPNR